MECVIDKDNVKIFSQVLHSLAKVGEMISFDSKADMLCVVTFNSAQSAYMAFYLKPKFFLKYSGFKRGGTGRNFRIMSKYITNIFKNMGHVKRISITANGREDNNCVKIQLFMENGVDKTYKLHFEQVDVQQAILDKDDYPVVYQCDAKVLNVLLSNFDNKINEVKFILEASSRQTPQGSSSNQDSSQSHLTVLRIVTYFDDEETTKTTLNTTMSIDQQEFKAKRYTLPPPSFDDATAANNSQHQVQELLSMTFTVKYLRTYLTFCESALQPIEIYLSQHGTPFYCRSISNHDELDDIESELLLATVQMKNTQSQQSSHEQSSGVKSTPSQDSTKRDAIKSYGTASTSTDSESQTRKRKQSSQDLFSSLKSDPYKYHVSQNNQMDSYHSSEASSQKKARLSPSVPDTPDRGNNKMMDDDDDDDDRVLEEDDSM
ncbi:cell cycle checkpoint control protein RAD9 [Acrasis kona]|uniref:Cell cycle checkpoint control protein RAD9 n=1 Tax=Acrasis kona TaxID=1008807 RepID=A0AAW2ZQW6_9EUKA